MVYSKRPIITFLDPAVVGSGIQKDLHSVQRLLWDAAENVTFYNGKAERRTPPGIFIDLAENAPIRGISQRQLSNGFRAVWAAAGGDVFRTDGIDKINYASMAYNIDQTSIADATYFDFTHFGDFTIINNSIEPAKIHEGGETAIPYVGPPEKVVTFLKKFNFILAIGHGLSGTNVSWSSADQINDWIPAQDNEAGQISIEDFDTHIKAGNRIGQNISVYAEDQMALVTYIDRPFYFGQRVVLDGIGAASKSAIISNGADNFGVGRNGVWWTDSTTYRYIDEGRMRDYFQDEVNWNQRSKIFAVRNDRNNTLEFFFPMRDSLDVNEGWSFDPRNSAWSLLPPVSYKDERRLFDWPLEGDFEGVLSYSEQDTSVEGALKLRTKPMLAQLQTAHGITDVHFDVEMLSFDIFLHEALNLQVRYGNSIESDGNIRWQDWQEAFAGNRTYRAKAGTPSGTYHYLEFRNSAIEWKMNLQGFLIFGNVDGSKLDGLT